jgi:hypothetical protein
MDWMQTFLPIMTMFCETSAGNSFPFRYGLIAIYAALPMTTDAEVSNGFFRMARLNRYG